MKRIANNTPRIFEKYQDQALRGPDIEDGNSPDNSKQGKIFTSEITVDDDYSVDYTATVTSYANKLNLTGSLQNYLIEIKYVADLAGPAATNPGFFGSNLLKENEAFTITSPNHDWVRGFINKVQEVTFIQIGTTFTYSYILDCTILQGLPKTVQPGDNFVWKRQRFMDKTSFEEAYTPVNLYTSFNVKNLDTLVYWNDVNESSIKYALNFRRTDFSDPVVTVLHQTFGKDINFRGNIAPIVDSATSDISCIKILDPGKNFAYYKRLEFAGDGEGASFIAAPTTIDGSLPIHKYNIEEISSIGGISTPTQVPDTFGQPLDTFTYIPTLTGPLLDGTYLGCPSVSTANGVGATFDVVVLGGLVDSVDLASPGTNYTLADSIKIDGAAFGGTTVVDYITIAVSTLIPTSYLNVPSGSTGVGTGATFNVYYDNLANMTVSIVNPGWGYVIGDIMIISSVDVGGLPANDINFIVTSLGNKVRIRAPKTEYWWSYPLPVLSAYLEGISNGLIFSITRANYNGLGIVPGVYTNIPSTTTGLGSGATFDIVVAPGPAIASIVINNKGYGYQEKDEITISGIFLGGASPNDDVRFNVSKIYKDYVVSSVTQISDNLFDIIVDYAVDTSLPLTFTSNSQVGNTIKIHNGIWKTFFSLLNPNPFVNVVLGSNKIDIPTGCYLPSHFLGTEVNISGFPIGTYITEINKQTLTLSNNANVSGPAIVTILGKGRGYTNKTRVKVKETPGIANFYLDPVYYCYSEESWFEVPNTSVSVAGIYSDNLKQYTEWTEEVYIKPIQ